MDSLDNPTVVAGYRIDGRLGEGGMGTVYRATQLSLERVVALKLLTAELSADPAFRERFRREGLLQAALDHPHIVTVYEAGETDNRLFLAMRMVEGPTLKDLILRRQLDDRRALRLLTQVAEALDAAHAKGLIHRDVKPQNVLVGAGDHAYLADFGLTKGNDDEAMTETGQFVGTIDYISPEQARGGRATGRSDVYALTAVLCECLTGRVPFERSTEERALLAHLTEPPPRLSQMRGDIPEAMDEVVARGMAKDPDDRPASAGELMLQARRAFGAAPAESTASAATEATRLRPVVGGPTRAPHTAAESDPGATRLAAAAVAAPQASEGRRGAPAGAPAVGEATPATGRPGTHPPTGTDTPPGQRATTGAPNRRFLPVLILAAVLALLAGLLLGGSSGSSGTAFNDSASAGYVELAFPSSWQRLGTPPTVPGLTFSQPLALSTAAATGASSSYSASSGQSLLAGEVNASGPSLLPAAFTAAVNGTLPHPTAVKLGSYEAYRYDSLSVHGLAAPLTLYTVPSTGGVVTISCLGSAAAAPGSQCAQIAATLKLNGTTAFALAPSQQYASSLGSAFGTLNSAVNTGTARLRKASSASAQAAAAAQLASAYTTASRALAKLSVSPAVRSINANLAASLAALSRDYAALAAAARAGNEAAYVQAQRAIGSDGTHMTSALTALRQAGYTVSG
ncbi:MAG: protein kinase [Solirubrobacteraceae bacterium]